MCGLAGIVDYAGFSEEALLRRMVGLLRHRGPDAAGLYMNGPAGMVHSRLRIIDLSTGDQPIRNEDGTLWIVFNGEIFNYTELKTDLIRKGHRFYTETDTEVLVHLYEVHGPDMLSMLNGQFAIALWDQRRQRLFLARDRLGVRPLFYYQKGKRLVFGSEIKALMADGQVPRKLNPVALGDIFTCWAPLHDLTAFEEIYQIPPGHYAVFGQEGLQISRYWQLSGGGAGEEDRSVAQWTEELQSLLLDATRLRLRADVPVGAYLSGGLDSTLISGMVQQNFNNRLCTFSVNFTDKTFDEAAFQEVALNALATEHRRIACSESDIGRVFPEVVWHCETPMLRTSPAPLHLLSDLVRQSGFRVVLTGEGADEMFAGYNIFKEDKVRRFWARQPDSRLRPLLLRRLYPYIFDSGNGKAGRFVEDFFRRQLHDMDSPVFSHLVRWENTAQLKTFFTDDVFRQTGGTDHFIHRYAATLPESFHSWDALSKAQYNEISLFLSNYLLASQGDRVAMAHGVEGRYPFLDHRVVDFAFRLPPRLRLNGLTEKYLVKQAARRYVPPALIARAKQPYRAPISRCFTGPEAPAYVERMLSETAIEKAGVFHAGKVGRLYEKCRRQQGRLSSERENMALVGIISTQLLYHQFVDAFPYTNSVGCGNITVRQTEE